MKLIRTTQKAILLLLSLIASNLPAFARDFEYTYEGQTLTYTVLDEEAKTCETKQGCKVSGELVIPSTATDESGKTYTVTTIGRYAFASCDGLTGGLTIPNSVISIGDAAFWNCSGFTGSLTIGNSVISIGSNAFEGCSGFTGDLTIPESVSSIGTYAFYDCIGLKSISFEESDKILEIGVYAFSRCQNLTDLFISRTIKFNTTNAGYPFSGGDIRNITFGKGCTVINSKVFYYIERLEAVFIPSSVSLISSYAFYGCTNLKSVDIEEGSEPLYMVGNLGSTGIEVLNLNRQLYEGEINIEGFGTYTCKPSFAGYTNLTSVNFGNNFTTIADEMFSGCTALRSVTIPSNIKKIGESAFSGCLNLKSINIEDCDEAILINSKTNAGGEGSTFAGIPLETLYLGRNVEYSGTELSPFKNKTLLTTLTIGNKTTAINNYLFYGCTNIAMLSVPSSVRTIGDYAFYDCNQSRSLTISKSVESIGEYAFYNCQNLKSLTIPGSVVSIGDYAFRSCSNLKNIKIGDKVETIGDYAFLDCYSAETITLGKSVKNIGANAFYNCQAWTSIEIPDSVKSIGNDAFALCLSAEEINIGNGVEKIGLRSFTDCENLTKLTIGKSVKEIGDMAFFNCEKLSQVYVAAPTPPIANESVFSDYSATLYVPDGKTEAYMEDTDLCWPLFKSTKEYTPAVSDPTDPELPSEGDNNPGEGGGDDDTGIEGVDSDLQDTVRVEGNSIIAPEGSVVYDLNGRRVKATNLAKGIYIVRLGSKAVKVRL